ncbi:MAG: two-component system, chemotaxis family, chemotaxis protein CheY [Pyrinomonadaceae bacterium]|nr:two-component system, chemotaxis family, chemotaxis protein CheY [Pyrinomonadaceae bacterium]
MPHILLVEDTQIVADAVRETLEAEGWQVETCADGSQALGLIHSGTRYDLLLLDNELPNVGGLELTRTARGLDHRKQTPIIMISASECGRAARRAGADAFIRKPEGIGQMVEIIVRLLNS